MARPPTQRQRAVQAYRVGQRVPVSREARAVQALVWSVTVVLVVGLVGLVGFMFWGAAGW